MSGPVRYRIVDGIVWRAFADEVVVYVATRSETHLLDGSVADLLSRLHALPAPRSAQELADLLLGDGCLPPEEAEFPSLPPVKRVLDDLVRIGVLAELAC